MTQSDRPAPADDHTDDPTGNLSGTSTHTSTGTLAQAPAMPRRQIEAALSLWRPGATREALVDLLDEVVNGAADGTPPLRVAERVAAFDHDGTMAVEKPRESVFEFFEWWADGEGTHHLRPVLGRLTRFNRALHLGGIHLPNSAGPVHQPGRTVEEYEQNAGHFLDTWSHPRLGRRWPELVYAPMLQLVDLLHRLGFAVWLVSASSRDYLRVMSEAYHLPRERIVATEVPVTWRGGRLVREYWPTRTTLGAAKPAALWAAAGRRPVLAIGNTSHDVRMLESARLGLMVCHDDPEREFGYRDRRAEDAARAHGWPVISMRHDFVAVFESGDDAADPTDPSGA